MPRKKPENQEPEKNEWKSRSLTDLWRTARKRELIEEALMPPGPTAWRPDGRLIPYLIQR